MCIYAMCVTLQNVCLLASQDAQCRVGTTPNMTATQMVEHVLGTMKKEPAAHAEKAVGPMEPADGEQKAVKKGCFEEAFSCCTLSKGSDEGCW